MDMNINEEELARVITEVVKEELLEKKTEGKMDEMRRDSGDREVAVDRKDALPVIRAAVSARHMHITKEDFEALFGSGAVLTEYKPLSQPGQFAANEKIDLIGPKNTIAGVRILGPFRKQSQIEVSITDCIFLGVPPVIRQSGDVKGAPGIRVRGPKGEITLKEGVIVAGRHLHAHTDDAKVFGFKDKDILKLRKGGERGVVFENVLVRVSPEFRLEFHIDTDEGNAANISQGDPVEIV